MRTGDENRIFAENLDILLRQRGWSNQDAAEELHYDRNLLSSILSGNQNFRLETAVKFARYFKAPLFLMFSRNFKISEYREDYSFVETDYMEVLRNNFRALHVKQADVAIDSSTMCHIMKGRRKNLTINTLRKIAVGASVPLSELLKTRQDREIEEKRKEAAE